MLIGFHLSPQRVTDEPDELMPDDVYFIARKR
jgi:hypothetical protein